MKHPVEVLFPMGGGTGGGGGGDRSPANFSAFDTMPMGGACTESTSNDTRAFEADSPCTKATSSNNSNIFYTKQ